MTKIIIDFNKTQIKKILTDSFSWLVYYRMSHDTEKYGIKLSRTKYLFKVQASIVTDEKIKSPLATECVEMSQTEIIVDIEKTDNRFGV